MGAGLAASAISPSMMSQQRPFFFKQFRFRSEETSADGFCIAFQADASSTF